MSKNIDCTCSCRSKISDLIHKDITLAEYNKLSAAERNSGVIYFITDVDNTNESRILALEKYCKSLQEKLEELGKEV